MKTLSPAQQTAINVVQTAKKVWRSGSSNKGWQVDGNAGFDGYLDPRPVHALVQNGFCEIVDGYDPDPNADWHDHNTVKVVLTDKGEAWLAGVLLN
jgi:hypothetical protein